MEHKDENVQSQPDRIEELERAAHSDMLTAFDNNAKNQLRSSLDRVAAAERVLRNEQLRHETLKADLRAGRETPYAPQSAAQTAAEVGYGRSVAAGVFTTNQF